MSISAFSSRGVGQVLLSREQGEGDGARVRRSIGRPELKSLDPFLMLDEFNVGSPAGFPSHPHRGFETVTYMLKGTFQHEDFCGHYGKIGPGDLQWMTAGKGIVHSEIPFGKEKSHGLQLWVNLKSKDKLVDPAYQELKSEDVARETTPDGGVSAIIIAGTALNKTSPVYTRTPTHYVHYKMKANQKVDHVIPEGFNAFLYTLNGKVGVGGEVDTMIGPHNTITLDRSEGGRDGVTIRTTDEEADFVLVAGEPTGEPVVQHGPFVMNTQREIDQAMTDFFEGKNGFEKAPGWKAGIDSQR